MNTQAHSAEIELLRKKLRIMELEVEVYREMGGLAVKGADRSTLLTRLMEFALKAIDASSGALYSVDEKGGLSPEAIKGTAGLRHKSLAEMSAKSARPCMRKRGAHPRGLQPESVETVPGGALAVPLTSEKKVRGVIVAVNRPGRGPFTESDRKVLSSLANHLSIILERAELVASLDSRVNQLSILNEVSGLLISSLDHNVVRHRAMEAITRLMRAEAGSLLLLDREKGELYFEVALGEKSKKIKEIRLKMGEGIAGWVAEHNRPVITHDVTKDRRFQGKVDRESKFRTRNMVCVPVVIKGQVIGVLQAINRTEGEFTEEDVELFQLFSNQAAIALDNARLYEETKEAFYATSAALAEAIEKRDPYTGGHTRRVLAYCMAIASHLDISEEEIEALKLAAVLHDIGKIGIEDRILLKKTAFDPDEALTMRMHPQLGADILKQIPKLKDIMPGMLHHHERFDGFGYPLGLKGEDIPLTARIIAVADTYDAITTTRPYRKGMTSREAIAEIKRCAGRQFDINVVEAFLKAFKKDDIDGKARKKSRAAGAREYDLV